MIKSSQTSQKAQRNSENGEQSTVKGSFSKKTLSGQVKKVGIGISC